MKVKNARPWKGRRKYLSWVIPVWHLALSLYRFRNSGYHFLVIGWSLGDCLTKHTRDSVINQSAIFFLHNGKMNLTLGFTFTEHTYPWGSPFKRPDGKSEGCLVNSDSQVSWKHIYRQSLRVDYLDMRSLFKALYLYSLSCLPIWVSKFLKYLTCPHLQKLEIQVWELVPRDSKMPKNPIQRNVWKQNFWKYI